MAMTGGRNDLSFVARGEESSPGGGGYWYDMLADEVIATMCVVFYCL